MWNAGAMRSIAAHAQGMNADVVHFHNTFPLLSPASYYGIESASVVQTLHNYRLVCAAATLMRDGKHCQDCVGHSGWRSVLHGCYRDSRAATLATVAMTSAHRMAGTWSRKVHAYIALTPFTRDVFVRGGLPAERIFVKPNFIDPDPGFAPDESRRGFLFVGRLEEGKGIRLLLDAWRSFAGVRPLTIIGDGPLASEMRALAAERTDIVMLGAQPRERVFAEMRKARALVAPMIWFENFPLSVCEAMASGCPVIAADNENMSGILQGGAAGVLFRTGDAVALAHAVERIDEDAALRRRVAARARSEYEAKYTAAANYTALMNIYEHTRSRSSQV
jgi:glycosyltransferase involved in cell wall biosynthesis